MYDTQGRFVRNIDIPWTPVTPPRDGKPAENGGAAVSLDLSRDADQSLMFLINQNSARVDVETFNPDGVATPGKQYYLANHEREYDKQTETLNWLTSVAGITGS